MGGLVGQLMIPSVRNSKSQTLAVLDDAKCNKVLHTTEFTSRIADLKTARADLQTYVVADVDDLLGSCQAQYYPYDKSWCEARNDPILIAHSSGSTGN